MTAPIPPVQPVQPIAVKPPAQASAVQLATVAASAVPVVIVCPNCKAPLVTLDAGYAADANAVGPVATHGNVSAIVGTCQTCGAFNTVTVS